MGQAALSLCVTQHFQDDSSSTGERPCGCGADVSSGAEREDIIRGTPVGAQIEEVAMVIQKLKISCLDT